MSLADLTDPSAVEFALDEFDQLGREVFLAKYGFGPARRYFLVRGGKRYDSKAIAAVAHRYQHPQKGPLASSAFSGGDSTVRRRLEQLGFRVIVDPGPADRRYWALVANPTIYRIEDAVREITLDTWTTKGRPLSRGDAVVIWKARGRDETRGVVAFGEVLSDPELMSATEADVAMYWVDALPSDLPEERVWIRYITASNLPLWVDGPADAELRDLSVERARGGTVFHIEPDQWAALIAAAGELWDDVPNLRAARQVVEDLARGSGKSQGFAGSSEERRCVEQHAMTIVTSHFAALGWTIHDVSTTHSYDLRCVDVDKPDLHVEVKGSRGDGAQVLLTPNEVTHAREWYPNVALAVVSNIVVESTDHGLMATGGELQICLPWAIEDGTLTPIGYAYRVPDDILL